MRETTARAPELNTLGASPGELVAYLFGSPMNVHSVEYLIAQLGRDWKKEDIPELDEMIANVASGYYRSELIHIRRNLNA